MPGHRSGERALVIAGSDRHWSAGRKAKPVREGSRQRPGHGRRTSEGRQQSARKPQGGDQIAVPVTGDHVVCAPAVGASRVETIRLVGKAAHQVVGRRDGAPAQGNGAVSLQPNQQRGGLFRLQRATGPGEARQAAPHPAGAAALCGQVEAGGRPGGSTDRLRRPPILPADERTARRPIRFQELATVLLSRYPDAVHAHAGPLDRAARQVDRIRHHRVEVPLRAAATAAGRRRGGRRRGLVPVRNRLYRARGTVPGIQHQRGQAARSDVDREVNAHCWILLHRHAMARGVTRRRPVGGAPGRRCRR